MELIILADSGSMWLPRIREAPLLLDAVLMVDGCVREWDLTLLPVFFLNCLTEIIFLDGITLMPKSPD